MDNVVFAYKYCQIVPKRLGSNGQWLQHTTTGLPTPPRDWQRRGFSSDWRAWRTGEELRDEDVIPRQAYSLVWCQRNQTYWVFPMDCTDQEQVAQADENADEWQTLQCHPLGEDTPSRPGLWKLCDWSNTPQHGSECPPDFDEFLPGNFFTGSDGAVPCHFVGHFSLILALQAMCPKDVNEIPNQIDEIFYNNGQPEFLPARRRGGLPMERHSMH